METIGSKLKIVRKFMNMTQESVAEKLAVTNQTLSRYENDLRSPDASFLQHFGNLFNVNGNWLLYGRGDMFIDGREESKSRSKSYKEFQFYMKKIEELFLEEG